VTDELKNKPRRLEAMLALALGGQSAAGPKPTFEEIAAWHAGHLSEPRASEVKAHVARDPECYRFWYELRLEERVSDQSRQTQQRDGAAQEDRASGPWEWLKSQIPVSAIGMSAAGLAGAMAVVFAVMVALPLIRSPDLYERIDLQYAAWEDEPPQVDVWPWRKSGVEKGLGSLEELLAKPDPEKNAFRVGVRTALQNLAADAAQWRKTIESLPDTLQPCVDGDAKNRCRERQHLLHASGQWSALVFLSCKAQSPRAEAFWVEQYGVLQELKSELASASNPGELTLHLVRWTPQAGGSAVLCEGAETLLTLGLSH
jgi:hypothetical protein